MKIRDISISFIVGIILCSSVHAHTRQCANAKFENNTGFRNLNIMMTGSNASEFCINTSNGCTGNPNIIIEASKYYSNYQIQYCNHDNVNDNDETTMSLLDSHNQLVASCIIKFYKANGGDHKVKIESCNNAMSGNTISPLSNDEVYQIN